MALLLISLLFLTLAFFLLKNNLRKSGQPPSPAMLPIIGNLHQLGTLPHRSLHALCLKHGPLMLLHLGATPHYVVSSADMAREVMQVHDVVFSDRPSSIITDRFFYAGKDVAFAQYGEYWRQEVEIMINAISESPTSINLSEILISTTNNIVSRVAFGKKYFDEKQRSGIGFRQLLAETLALMGVFHIGDLFPTFAWVAYFTGLDARVKNTFKEWDNFLDQVIEDHLVARRENDYRGGDDFVHVLLDIQQNGGMDITLDKESVKGLLLAVIKEIARLHPPLQLLVPRQTTHNVKLQGYQIPAKSKVIINAWAIGRDPKWWEDPMEFRPERFMNKSIDFKGLDYELIPFGAGRRGCPGIPFAIAVIELALANLLNVFEWHLPGGVKGEEIDMAETFGITVHKTFPLIVTARPHF